MKVQNLVQSIPLGSEAAYFGGSGRGQRLSDHIRIVPGENLARSQYPHFVSSEHEHILD
jgi:hypothetical protein